MDPVPRTRSLPIALDRSGPVSLQRQLASAIKHLVRRGALPAGASLPSTRALADDLMVSRNTVTAAYDQLVGEGYLEARARSGLRVNVSLDSNPTRMPRRASRPVSATTIDPPPLTSPAPFRPCQPDVRLFPLALWNRLRSRRLRLPGTSLLHYQSGHPLGLPDLRRSLADYLAESRGVRCHWQQVAVTSGSQQALYLVGQAAISPGARVLMEDPGYPGALQVWVQRGATVDTVAVDEQGAQVPDPSSMPRVDLVYLTPSRQHPTGVSLPVGRRLQWLQLVTRRGGWLVEDDYDSEIRFGRPPLPSVHGLDAAGRVIYVGSMSKVLFPSLRIGYVVLPDALVDRVAALRMVIDNHGPLLDQATLAAFIDSGAFARHLRRCRRVYREWQAVFLERVRTARLDVEFADTDGGMSVLGRLPDTVDDAAVARALAASGFDVPALSAYSRRAVPPGLVFGYTAFNVVELSQHVTRLARVLPRAMVVARTPRGRRRSS